MITGKYSTKPYKCTGCGQEVEIGTNHWGEVYPNCYVCGKPTVWKCLESMPKGYSEPPRWQTAMLIDLLAPKKEVKLKEVAKIMKKSKETKVK